MSCFVCLYIFSDYNSEWLFTCVPLQSKIQTRYMPCPISQVMVRAQNFRLHVFSLFEQKWYKFHVLLYVFHLQFSLLHEVILIVKICTIYLKKIHICSCTLYTYIWNQDKSIKRKVHYCTPPVLKGLFLEFHGKLNCNAL